MVIFDCSTEAPGQPVSTATTSGRPSIVPATRYVDSGWGGYILTQADYVNAFFSHDEYIDFFAVLDNNR